MKITHLPSYPLTQFSGGSVGGLPGKDSLNDALYPWHEHVHRGQSHFTVACGMSVAQSIIPALHDNSVRGLHNITHAGLRTHQANGPEKSDGKIKRSIYEIQVVAVSCRAHEAFDERYRQRNGCRASHTQSNRHSPAAPRETKAFFKEQQKGH